MIFRLWRDGTLHAPDRGRRAECFHESFDDKRTLTPYHSTTVGGTRTVSATAFNARALLCHHMRDSKLEH